MPLNEECAVAAVYSKKNDAAFHLHKMLLQQQHRGQLSAGIAVYDKSSTGLIHNRRRLGKVENLFKLYHKEKFENILKNNSGKIGIGHVRYATSGSNDEELAQPFERHHGLKDKSFNFAFNGNIENYSELKEEAEKEGFTFYKNVDTELIKYLICKELSKNRPLKQVFNNLSKKLKGSYSIVLVNGNGELVIARDPHGFKPLCYTINKQGFFAASESVAINNDGENEIQNVKAGEMITVSDKGIKKEFFAKSKRISHCMFEWAYFASPNSVIENKSVYEVRQNLGKILANQEKTFYSTKDFIVVSVPDTAKPIGDALAYELDLPSMEGILRNRYIGRTFIEEENREEKVREKYSIVKSVLKDKKVILVEDSLVRGTTTKGLIQRIKKYGEAKEVHLRVACPPILSPCYYGIDIKTKGELLATPYVKNIKKGLTKKQNNKLAKDYGADSLIYLPIERLPEAIGINKEKLCMACLNGEYPTRKC